MRYIKLGSTNLIVSRLCFGGLTVGPLQTNLPIEEGAQVIARAFNMGVNFIDTAKLYKTYPYIKRAMQISNKKDIIISSKSYDFTYEGMRDSLQEALDELEIKKISIFSLHEQESRLTLKGHSDALRYLKEAKNKGLIDAVGVSTHAVEVVNAAADMGDIDVIHPIVNINGLGILDGTIEEMLLAVENASKKGKGIYTMKPLGGGNYTRDADKCFDFVLKNPYIHSIAVGMQCQEEVEFNIAKFDGLSVDEKIKKQLSERSKRLHIDSWCIGCGNCVKACTTGALSLKDGKAVLNKDKCVLCGYCSSYCRDFCIKIV